MRLPSVSSDKDRPDLCPDRPFRAPEHGCGHSDPSTSCRSRIARSSEPFPQHLPCLHIPGWPTSEKNVNTNCSLLWEVSPTKDFSTAGKVSGPVWLDLSAEVLLFCLSYLKRQREREEREGKGSHIIITDNRMQNCTFYS